MASTTTRERKTQPFKCLQYLSQLRPNSWKSDTHLNQKQVNRNTKENTNKTTKIKQLSKSSDWTDAALHVPDGDDEAIHLPNPKLSLIFDNDKDSKTTTTTPPIPPPRKHKKGLREKIETVAKNSLQVFQSKKPVDEPLCVKKIIQPTCPTDEHDCAIHNRNHKREQRKNEFNQKQQQQQQQHDIDKTKITKDTKRRKNLSVVSLPNYNELKLTIAKFDDIDKNVDDHDNSSATSLPNEAKKLTSSCGRLETCMTRCRSFGSLLPQQLLDRWKVRKIPTDNESDDSFGALEDWDLRLIEHYNPKDASLPRPSTRKLQKNDNIVLKDVESMIVATNDENLTTLPTPKAPVRKSESLIKKKMNNNEVLQVCNKDKCSKNIMVATTTTTSSANLKSEENNNDVEHSTLMKILEKYSIEDKQRTINEKNIEMEVENCSFKFRQNLKLIEDFLCNEKMNIDRDLNVINNTNLVKT